MKKYDIVVVGGGFAGAAAAIAAGREGKKVLIIEKYNCFGGAAIYDLVNPFMKYWTTVNGVRKDLSAGIFSEIMNSLRAENAICRHDPKCFNEEVLKLILNRMVIDAGVEILFQTYVTDVIKEDGKIIGIKISNVSGNSIINADYFIDATGDANLSALAECPYMKGRKGDNMCQPMTLCFRVANVNHSLFFQHRREIEPLYLKFQAEGKIKNPRENVLVFYTVLDGILHFNSTRVVKLDPTNAEEVTKAEILAREQVFELYNFLKDNFEAMKDSVLISTGIQIGVRESRMIEGDYILTKDDLLAFTRFEDGIAACNYDIDIHSPDGSGTSHYFFPEGEYYTIPYRCLTPKGVDNLLVAGRCVSADHDAQASLRIMPVCCTLGEAAGVAAAIACETKSTTRAIDVQKLRQKLREKNAVVD